MRVSMDYSPYRDLPVFNLANFFANRDHRLAEAIEFGLRFRLGRLDHQSTNDWPRHGWCVEAIIDQSFCDVFNFRRTLSAGARSMNALVSDAAIFTAVKNRVVSLRVVSRCSSRSRSRLQLRASNRLGPSSRCTPTRSVRIDAEPNGADATAETPSRRPVPLIERCTW